MNGPWLDDDAPAPESALDDVVVRRSARRRRTVSATREDGRIVVSIPASFSKEQEEQWVRTMIDRLRRKEQRARVGEGELMARARTLSQTYLEGAARPASVEWVGNQNTRWGSCTPSTGAIRLSDRLRSMPSWVVDYVLLHELAHLIRAHHDDEFWHLVERYPRTDRARGFLDGWSYAHNVTPPGQWDADAP